VLWEKKTAADFAVSPQFSSSRDQRLVDQFTPGTLHAGECDLFNHETITRRIPFADPASCIVFVLGMNFVKMRVCPLIIKEIVALIVLNQSADFFIVERNLEDLVAVAWHLKHIARPFTFQISNPVVAREPPTHQIREPVVFGSLKELKHQILGPKHLTDEILKKDLKEVNWLYYLGLHFFVLCFISTHNFATD